MTYWELQTNCHVSIVTRPWSCAETATVEDHSRSDVRLNTIDKLCQKWHSLSAPTFQGDGRDDNECFPSGRNEAVG